jgi:hypothetical protein
MQQRSVCVYGQVRHGVTVHYVLNPFLTKQWAWFEYDHT